MAFRLHRREKARAAFRRVGIELIEDMGRFLDPGKGPVDVHEARKASKMSRALLRLFQAGLSDRTRRTENLSIREFARLLSKVRDAEVRLATFRSIAAVPELQGMKAIREVESHLADSAREQSSQSLPTETLVKARAKLVPALARWRRLRLKGHEWSLIEAGLRKSYRKARRGHAAFIREVSDVNIHEWRKAVKSLGYAVDLLCALRPAKLRDLRRKLDSLGDVLGNHHDLVVLRGYLAGEPWAADGLVLLDLRISQRQSELCVQAERIALEVLCQKPREFTEHFAKWWKHWRR